MNDPKLILLRPVDLRRLRQAGTRATTPPTPEAIWYIHTVLAQCFLPYRDPQTETWYRKNGEFSLLLRAGAIEMPQTPGGYREVGLPYGAKPRLFQSYLCTQALKQRSPVIHVERSMTAMLQELGFSVRGGPRGTIASFKEQITRFAACHFTIVGPGPRGTRRHCQASPIKRFDVWFPPDPNQATVWPSEIVLTDDYYLNLREHAIPFHFQALKTIQNKPRAQDISLWMTQRLCHLAKGKPLLLRWESLYEMFGGELSLKHFKSKFSRDLLAARTSYPDACVEEQPEGWCFHHSPPPIPKTKSFLQVSRK
jgi:Plasmid encoded RepA protein